MRAVGVIARHDLAQLRQARDFWVPPAIIATLMFVVVPALLLTSLATISDPGLLERLGELPGHLPETERRAPAPAGPAVGAAYSVATFLFAPLITLVPLTVVSACAANTFVGERERGSGEFLAHSPAPTADIHLGKLVAVLVPAGLVAVVGFVGYGAVTNLVLAPQTGRPAFPTGNWWLVVVWLVPATLTLASALILTVSSRVSSGAAAQQAASVIALPLVALVYTLGASSTFGATWPAWAAGAGLWVAALVAVRTGAGALRRDRLLGMG